MARPDLQELVSGPGLADRLDFLHLANWSYPPTRRHSVTMQVHLDQYLDSRAAESTK